MFNDNEEESKSDEESEYEDEPPKKLQKCIIKLFVPEEAEYVQPLLNNIFTNNNTKNRCSFAKVLEIQKYDKDEIVLNNVMGISGINELRRVDYVVGQMVYPDKWEPNDIKLCSHGIHVFKNRDCVQEYGGKFEKNSMSDIDKEPELKKTIFDNIIDIVNKTFKHDNKEKKLQNNDIKTINDIKEQFEPENNILEMSNKEILVHDGKLLNNQETTPLLLNNQETTPLLLNNQETTPLLLNNREILPLLPNNQEINKIKKPKSITSWFSKKFGAKKVEKTKNDFNFLKFW